MHCKLALIGPPFGAQNVIAEPHPSEDYQAIESQVKSQPTVTTPAAKQVLPSQKKSNKGKLLTLSLSLIALLSLGWWLPKSLNHQPVPAADSPASADSSTTYSFPNLPSAQAMAEILPPDDRHKNQAPSERVDSYAQALARAKATGNDIVVYQYGSDWNRLSLHLWKHVWNSDPFFKSLGNGFILLAIDNQETPAAPPMPLSFGKLGNIRSGTTFDKTVPAEELNAQLTNSKGENEITSITSQHGVQYSKDNEGVFTLSGSLGLPASEIVKLTLTPAVSGKFIRVDFPAGNTPFVEGCSGLASNGNFALAAVRVATKNASLKITALEARASAAEWVPATLPVNGSTKPGCWNAAAHTKQPNTLIITLSEELPAGSPVTVELDASTQFSGHIPGSVRACVMDDLAEAQNYDQVPTSELNEVAGASGNLPYTHQPDGTYFAQISPNPPHDKLQLKLKATSPSNLIRLDFPRDKRVPNGGVGRAGNAVITEATIRVNGQNITAQHAWGNGGNRGGFAAYTAIDGILDKPSEGWNLNGAQGQDKTLFIMLPQTVTGDVEVDLLCQSQWNSHIPTRLAARCFADPLLSNLIANISSFEARELKNALFDWNDQRYCPRIALMDASGRAVACENAPRIHLTPAKMASRVHQLRSVREQRDALWAKADQASGPARATLLVEGMQLIRNHIGETTGIGLWDGNAHCYAPILKAIEEADPKNESWAQLVYRVGLDHRCGLAALDPTLRQAGARDYASEAGEAQKTGDFAKAIAIYDEMVAHPNYKKLEVKLQQRILHAKFNVFRAWQGHEAQATEVLREIASLSNDTTTGIGAQGIYDYTHTAAMPQNFTNGWGGQQLKPGVNNFEFIRGLDIYFTAPGAYQLCIARRGGNDSAKIQHVALYDGDTLLSESTPTENEITTTTPTVQLPLRIDPKLWKSTNRQLRLKIQVNAVATAPNATAVDLPVNLLATRMLDDIPMAQLPANLTPHAEILKQLNSRLNEHADLSQKKVRLDLAQHELITECGPEFLDRLRERPGGHALLTTIANDVDWIEEFLTSDPPAGSFAIALDNMRILRNHCPDLDVPVFLRLATAMALSAGTMGEVQLVEAFNNYHQAHNEMLLYRDFETLDVRSLRTVVDFCTPQDYSFLLNDRQVTPGSALGACGAIWYMTTSSFGGSIFGGGYLNCYYHTPWRWRFQGSETAFKSGGVCGSLSSFGSHVARVHGIQSHNVGQPAHCAYVVRIGKGWPVGNYVAGPTGCGVPGWDGVGYNTAATLQEVIKQDRNAVLNAARQTWLTHWKRNQQISDKLSFPSSFRYTVYPWRGNGMPDFSKIKPIKSGQSCWPSTADLNTGTPIINACAAVWEGEFSLQQDADITCILRGHHEAHLWIDDQEIIGIANNQSQKDIPLKAGTHKIKLTYLHLNEHPALSLQLKVIPKSGPWLDGYEAAIAAHPKNYAVWQEYIRSVTNTKPLDHDRLKSLGIKVSKNFSHDPEAAWSLISACSTPLKGLVPAEEIKQLFFSTHRHLKFVERDPRYPEGFDMGNVLAWQVSYLPDLEMQLSFVSSILRLHFSKDATHNAYFGSMLNWSNQTYGNRPETAERYSTALGLLFRSMADSMDSNILLSSLDGGIRNASTRGDLPSYRNWLKMAKQWGPPVDIQWDEAQAQLNAQHAQPLPGQLLSPQGLIQCSAPSSVFAYSALQQEGEGAHFFVNKMKHPWITLQLGGESDVSGIVIIGHRENFKDQLPLKISVSMDNVNWTEVANITTYAPSLRIDLADKNVKARFVRLERPENEPDQFIHLRNFLVYGKPLY